MNMLITGGAGFIGLKLANSLKKDYNIDIVDFQEKLTENIRNEFNCFGFDLSESNWIDGVSKNYDYIIHCAAQTGGYNSLKNPQIDCKWNCLGTINVVELAKKCNNLKKIIYTSSMSVYGEGVDKNEESKLNPISYYGVSKLAAEYYVKLCWAHSQIPYTILRLWNTYGSGQDLENDHQGMLSIYLSQALDSNTINIKGPETRIRDFIHVSDVIKAIHLCMVEEKSNNQIFNVCSGIKTTSKEIIDELSRQLNKDLKIQEIEGYAGDQQFSAGSSKKLRQLGWVISKDLKSGIEEFLNNL